MTTMTSSDCALLRFQCGPGTGVVFPAAPSTCYNLIENHMFLVLPLGPLRLLLLLLLQMSLWCLWPPSCSLLEDWRAGEASICFWKGGCPHVQNSRRSRPTAWCDFCRLEIPLFLKERSLLWDTHQRSDCASPSQPANVRATVQVNSRSRLATTWSLSKTFVAWDPCLGPKDWLPHMWTEHLGRASQQGTYQQFVTGVCLVRGLWIAVLSFSTLCVAHKILFSGSRFGGRLHEPRLPRRVPQNLRHQRGSCQHAQLRPLVSCPWLSRTTSSDGADTTLRRFCQQRKTTLSNPWAFKFVPLCDEHVPTTHWNEEVSSDLRPHQQTQPAFVWESRYNGVERFDWFFPFACQKKVCVLVRWWCMMWRVTCGVSVEKHPSTQQVSVCMSPCVRLLLKKDCISFRWKFTISENAQCSNRSGCWVFMISSPIGVQPSLFPVWPTYQWCFKKHVWWMHHIKDSIVC